MASSPITFTCKATLPQKPEEIASQILDLSKWPEFNGSVFLMAVDDPATREDERTILDDGESDVLTGSAGLDWFFFDLSLDRATDRKDEIFANELEWILSE